MNFQDNRSLGHQISKGTIAAWNGDYKLIHYLNSSESLLFNLTDDPGEMMNLINSEYHRGDKLLTLIKVNLEKVNKKLKDNN